MSDILLRDDMDIKKCNIDNMPKLKISYSRASKVDFETLDKTSSPEIITVISGEKLGQQGQTHTALEYRPFRISQVQRYNPMYSVFFNLSPTNYDNIFFNHRFHIKTLDTLFDTINKTEVPGKVFIKFSPLLDPLRYMMGKYDITDTRLRKMPSITSTENECHSKLLSCMNSAYTDNMFCYLTSMLLSDFGFINGINYYGSFLGIQERFRINTEDNLEYLSDSPFFRNNIGKIMYLDNYGDDLTNMYNYGSRGNKIRLNIEPLNTSTNIDLELDDTDDICKIIDNIDLTGNIIEDSEVDIVLGVEHDDKEINSSKSCTIHSTSINSSEDSDTTTECSSNDNNSSDEWEDDDDDENEEYSDTEEDIPDTYAYINDFPVQMICMEKCDGTLDDLLERKILSEHECISAIFQVIMTLVVYQRSFEFTHNDLHTNNIMYSTTTLEYIYYKFDGNKYRVPTFGRIYKIIDFGRSIYKMRGMVFCSDSFAQGGDAYGQYNCEPFINANKPIRLPSYSFDLCRLGCSLFDFFFEEDFPVIDSSISLLKKMIYDWCIDDTGNSVLYKKNGDERYPGFKLYKMASRTKTNSIPKDEIKRDIFTQYVINQTNLPSDDINTIIIVDIDAMPIVGKNPDLNENVV